MSLYHARLTQAQETGIQQLNKYTYIVPSDSTDDDAINRLHLVTWDTGAKRFFCACKGMRFKDKCSGIKEVLRVEDRSQW